MNDGFSLKHTFTLIVDNLTRYVTDFVPRALTGFVILLLGWLIAKILQKALTGLLSRVRFDEFLERLGITEMLARAALKDKPSNWVPRIIYYVVVVMFVRISAVAIGLDAVAETLDAILAYMPSFVAAVLILLFGNVIAQFAGNTVATSAGNSGIDYASTLGRLVSGVVMFLVMIFALAQLKIDMAIVNSVVLIVAGGFALAFALAFGLGARGIMRNIVAGFYARKAFRVGDEVEVGGVEGTVRSIGATLTLLERKGKRVVVPNQVFVDASRD